MRVLMKIGSTLGGNLSLNAMTALSGAGMLETGFLSYQKISQVPLPFCGEVIGEAAKATCGDVLSGPYSVLPVFDIPLVYFAFASYATVAFLSNYLSKQSSSEAGLNSKSPQIIGNFLLGTTAFMGSFSVYLMAVLTLVLQTQCMFCYTSAFLSIATAALAYNYNSNKTTAAVIGTSSVAVTSMFSALLFCVTSSTAASASTAPMAQILAAAEQVQTGIPSTARPPPAAKASPAITTKSSARAVTLAINLEKADAKMYGAYWCSHCFNQKQEFGKEAFYEHIKYIECDKEGADSQYSMCRKKDVPGYPTWEIGTMWE
jgi:uncharacterized membrane protein